MKTTFRKRNLLIGIAFVSALLGLGACQSMLDRQASTQGSQGGTFSCADGTNEKVRIILRETMAEITNFGDGGRQPGQFYGVHSIATDSKGNIYTTETYEGKRLQKFVYKGMGTVPREQGVVWPRGR